MLREPPIPGGILSPYSLQHSYHGSFFSWIARPYRSQTGLHCREPGTPLALHSHIHNERAGSGHVGLIQHLPGYTQTIMKPDHASFHPTQSYLQQSWVTYVLIFFFVFHVLWDCEWCPSVANSLPAPPWPVEYRQRTNSLNAHSCLMCHTPVAPSTDR